MKVTKTLTSVLLALTFTVAGCAQVPQKGGLAQVQSLVSDRTGQRVYWRQGGEEDQKVDQAINDMLKHPLTNQQAVSIALLNNRNMQVTFEKLGITQAEVVQAGLLKNPTLGVLARWPSRSVGTGSNVELDVIFNFLDLALLPIRKRMAELEFDRVQMEVAQQAIDMVGHVQEAYINLQSAQQIHKMRMMTFEASDAAYELARRLHEAGNISKLELEREQDLLEQSRIEASKAALDVTQDREALAKLLGLYGKAMAFRVREGLPELPAAETATNDFEALAMQRRLDLAAAVKETQLQAKSLGITKNYRFMLISDIGVQTERELDGTWMTGPQLMLELPIFDQKQAQLAKAEAQLRQSEHRLWAMAVEIRSDVRAAYQRMLAARKLAMHYRDVVIPLRESIVKHTTEQYNYMFVGVFEAITAREKEYQAYQEYIQSVRDYWIAKVQLDTAVGGRPPIQTPDTSGNTIMHPNDTSAKMNMNMDMGKNKAKSMEMTMPQMTPGESSNTSPQAPKQAPAQGHQGHHDH